ncbi:MAG: SDR family oxidoreductase [Clostridiales bacterium]|nr:SDR family oxidoreductase [Clostridiales bacterium]
MSFENKVYIVTGSASGIGRSCAEKLLQNGAVVYGIDMKSGTIVNESYKHIECSVLDEDKISDSVRKIDEAHGQISGLVNAAGVWGNSVPFYEMDTDSFRRIIDVNTTGAFIVSKCVSKFMIEKKQGKIVNISCIRASIFRNNMADYAASKGAVVSMTSAMALDLAPFNIQVNSVAPGFTYTGMTAASFDKPEVREASEKIIPQGRLGTAEDVAGVVIPLLSEMSDYMTGTNVFVDGGYHIQK